MGHDLLTWLKQLLHICKCHATIFSTAIASGIQILPYRKYVKGHPSIIIWTNVVDFEFPILYIKIQAQSFLSSWEEDFKSVLPYMGMAVILFNGAKPFEQIVNIFLTEGPIW